MRKIIDFNVTGVYANAGATGAVTFDSTSGAVKIDAPMNTTTRARVYPTANTKSQPFVIGSSSRAFRLVFNADSPSSIKTISVYVSLDAAYTASGYFKVNAGNFIVGKNEVVFGWDNFIPAAGTTIDQFKSTPIVNWQVNLSSSATEASSISVVSFDALDMGAGAVVFMADDGWIEQYSIMMRVLEENGFLGAMTTAIIPAKIGTAGYMTVSNLREMKRLGCAICNHTMNHTVLGEATEAVQRLDTRLAYEWLKYLDLSDCPDYLIYPQGSYTATTLAIAKESFAIGRTVKEGLMTPWNDKYQLKIINLLPNVEIETVKRYIDRATTDGVGVIFLMHKLESGLPSTSTATTYYSTERFIEAVRYAREVSAPVMNLNCFVNSFLKG